MKERTRERERERERERRREGERERCRLWLLNLFHYFLTMSAFQIKNLNIFLTV